MITTDVETNREFIGENQRGILVKPGNVESLVEAMSLVFSDPEVSRNLGASANRFILEVYNWDLAVHKILEVCSHCLHN